MLDYETLRLIWWVLLGVLLIGFALSDGFDMGAGALLPFIAKTDAQRRVIINTVGPVWEGNQVWFVLGGGAIFAAWPALYALSFSGFYLAMFAVLAAMIIRPVAFKYRSKREGKVWRQAWDWALFTGSAVPALLFGVAVGNVLQGVPFHFTDDLRPIYEGNFFGLLNPLALLTGVLSLVMITNHGATWLSLKADKVIADRALNLVPLLSMVMVVLFVLLGVAVVLGWFGGYAVIGDMTWDGPSNPLYKTVEKSALGLMNNYQAVPLLYSVPAIGVLGGVIAALSARAQIAALSFVGSALSIVGIIATVGISMFPFLLPSSSNPSHSLMVFDASSSQMTLFIMLVCTLIFLPIVLAYTAYVYKVIWGRVTLDEVAKNDKALY